MTPKVLILGKDEDLPGDFADQWHNLGYRVENVHAGRDVAESLRAVSPDLVCVTSSSKDSRDGLTAVKQIRRLDRDIPIFLITRFSSENRAISAFRAGVTDYFRLPKDLSEVIERVKTAVNPRSVEIPCKTGKLQGCCGHSMIAHSQSMQQIRSYLQKVAVTDSTVLVAGETGTGKELAAQVIHRYSARREKPLVCVNCAALPETLVESELFGYDRGAFTGAVAAKPGKFELAGGGSLFLDEIGDMDLHAQAKVLRCIESKEVMHLGGNARIPLDVRVIAATNRDPEDLVTKGRFRQDLYYRLNVVRVNIPPLRERKEDIPALASFAVERLNCRFKRTVEGLSDEVQDCLMRYDWPGNVRELMNLIEAAYINVGNGKITRSCLPREFEGKLKGSRSSAKHERNSIVSALIATKWNKAVAARNLNWSRMTLYRKIEKYNIVEKRNRRG